MPHRYKYFVHFYEPEPHCWVAVLYREAPTTSLDPMVCPFEEVYEATP